MMSLTRKFYFTLVSVLEATQALKVGASLLQADQVIAQRFGVSESTARNWRRGRTLHISPAVVSRIIEQCAQVAPGYTRELEFIGRLSSSVQEVNGAAEALVEQLDEAVFTRQSNWHIYSGPLKFAFDPNYEQDTLRQLMLKSGMVAERFLELGADESSIPAMSELLRYSMHGWHATGMFAIRAASLRAVAGVFASNYIGKIEAALYIGDGCGVPYFFLGQLDKSNRCMKEAMSLLEDAPASEGAQGAVTRHDAMTMLRSIEAQNACYDNFERSHGLIESFEKEFGGETPSNGWIDGIRQATLGYIELARKRNYAKAADYFDQSVRAQDAWLAQFNVPFCSISPQSFTGYALLMAQGPTNQAYQYLSDGLLKTLEHGSVIDQIKSRYCISHYYDAIENSSMAEFHLNRANEQVQRYHLDAWFRMFCKLLPSRQLALAG